MPGGGGREGFIGDVLINHTQKWAPFFRTGDEETFSMTTELMYRKINLYIYPCLQDTPCQVLESVEDESVDRQMNNGTQKN